MCHTILRACFDCTHCAGIAQGNRDGAEKGDAPQGANNRVATLKHGASQRRMLSAQTSSMGDGEDETKSVDSDDPDESWADELMDIYSVGPAPRATTVKSPALLGSQQVSVPNGAARVSVTDGEGNCRTVAARLDVCQGAEGHQRVASEPTGGCGAMPVHLGRASVP